MEQQFSNFGRYISIFDRLMKMYYDRGLSEFGIGWGQQFYVESIYDHPGVSPQELSQWIHVDKATLTKSIKRLTEIGYVRVSVDERDRRVKHLYLTEKAVPAAERLKQVHSEFYDTFSSGISPEEMAAAEQLLTRMTGNITQKVWHRMEEHHGK